MRQFLFGLALFISSAAGLVIEIVAGRLLAPYVGMSLYTWTAIIAVVLAGLSAGHWIGGLLAGPHVDVRTGSRRVAYALALSSISALMSLVLLRTVSAFLMQSGLGTIWIIVTLATALFLLPSLFVGIVSPILTKIAVEQSRHHQGRVIGSMYALGTLGSIAGTLSAGYFFISWIGSSGTIIMVAGVYAVMAMLFAIADRSRGLLVALMVAGGSAVGYWGNGVNAFTSPCTVESDYFCIRIDDFAEAGPGSARLMALDHLVHSVNYREDPGYLFSPYIHFVDEYTRARLGNTDVDAFFIGGGGFTLPRAWSHERETASMMIAEIDPAVTTAATTSMWFEPKRPGVDVRHEDARVLLQRLEARPMFNVVFGDAFHDISIPAHLVTREFHDEIARRLKPEGFYAINVVDNGSDPRFMLSMAKTLMEDFPSVEVWVESGQIGSSGRVTYVVVAGLGALAGDVVESRRGPERRWIRWNRADLAGKTATMAGLVVLSDDFAPVDRLMSGALLSGYD